MRAGPFEFEVNDKLRKAEAVSVSENVFPD